MSFASTLASEMSFFLALKPAPMFQKLPKHIPQTQTPNQIQTHLVFPLSASMSLEEKIEVVLKNNHTISISKQKVKDSNHKLKAQNEYLRRQLGDFTKQKQKVLASPTSSNHGEEDVAVSNLMSSSS